VETAAAALLARGLQPGDAVAVASGNTLDLALGRLRLRPRAAGAGGAQHAAGRAAVDLHARAHADAAGAGQPAVPERPARGGRLGRPAAGRGAARGGGRAGAGGRAGRGRDLRRGVHLRHHRPPQGLAGGAPLLGAQRHELPAGAAARARRRHRGAVPDVLHLGDARPRAAGDARRGGVRAGRHRLAAGVRQPARAAPGQLGLRRAVMVAAVPAGAWARGRRPARPRPARRGRRAVPVGPAGGAAGAAAAGAAVRRLRAVGDALPRLHRHRRGPAGPPGQRRPAAGLHGGGGARRRRRRAAGRRARPALAARLARDHRVRGRPGGDGGGRGRPAGSTPATSPGWTTTAGSRCSTAPRT
jgi:hypothetical protein